MKNDHFVVRFTEVRLVQLASDEAALALMSMTLDMALKCSMMSAGLKAEGKSPRMFQLPFDKVDNPAEVLGRHLMKEYFDRNGVRFVLFAAEKQCCLTRSYSSCVSIL